MRENLLGQVETLVDTVPIVSMLASHYGMMKRRRCHQIFNAYTSILHHAKKAAVDPGLGLIMVHWPVPHPPGIYDRTTDTIVTHELLIALLKGELSDRQSVVR